MRRAAHIMILVGLAMALLTACSGPPTQDLAAARAAVDEVVSEGAELFAPEEMHSLDVKLTYALTVLHNEENDLVKNYRLARYILRQVKDDAEALKVKVVARKDALQHAAVVALGDARTAVQEARKLYEEALADQALATALLPLQFQLTTLEAALEQVPRQITAGDFGSAAERARAIADQAVSFSQSLRSSCTGLARHS